MQNAAPEVEFSSSALLRGKKVDGRLEATLVPIRRAVFAVDSFVPVRRGTPTTERALVVRKVVRRSTLPCEFPDFRVKGIQRRNDALAIHNFPSFQESSLRDIYWDACPD
jgi:hypothetical protein